MKEKEDSKWADFAKAEADMLLGFDAGYNKQGNDTEVQKALKENPAFAAGFANGQDWRENDDEKRGLFYQGPRKDFDAAAFETEIDFGDKELEELKELDRKREQEEERGFNIERDF